MYSNCLFEAIKAKIKDPKNVKIIRLPKEVNLGKIHFMWIKNDFVYHAFKKNSKESDLWFEYKINKVPVIVFQRWFLGALSETSLFQKYTKKYNLPLRDMEAVVEYKWHFTDLETTESLDDWAYDSYKEVKKIMKEEPQIKVIYPGTHKLAIMTFEEIKKIKGNFKYKFFTPYDEDFKSVYFCASKLEKATVLEYND